MPTLKLRFVSGQALREHPVVDDVVVPIQHCLGRFHTLQMGLTVHIFHDTTVHRLRRVRHPNIAGNVIRVDLGALLDVLLDQPMEVLLRRSVNVLP